MPASIITTGAPSPSQYSASFLPSGKVTVLVLAAKLFHQAAISSPRTGAKVYQGMIIGQNAKDNDLDVNPLKSKQLTNIRTTSKDEAVRLTPFVPMTLEQAMAYIEDDELVEVTPLNIRLRKRALLPHQRKRAKQSADA